MKKNIILIVFIANISFLSAQQLDLGLSFVPNASTTNFDMKNMVVTTGLLAHLNYSTKKSYHVIAYNFNATAITSFHGWLYTNDQDLYVVLSKNLKDTDGYLGLGWEFTISNGGFSPSAFVEIGTNYHFAESNFSIGIFAPLNKTIWKKKKSGGPGNQYIPDVSVRFFLFLDLVKPFKHPIQNFIHHHIIASIQFYLLSA